MYIKTIKHTYKSIFLRNIIILHILIFTQEDWDDDDDESEVTDEEYFYGDTGEMDEEEMSDDNPSPQADE
jgi:hypothetical protein